MVGCSNKTPEGSLNKTALFYLKRLDLFETTPPERLVKLMVDPVIRKYLRESRDSKFHHNFVIFGPKIINAKEQRCMTTFS